MKTVGKIVRLERERQNISLDEVEKATKIKKKFIEWLENDDLAKLPSPVTARGYIKNYADFLGLDSQGVLAVFKRDYVGVDKKPEYVLPSRWKWTPKSTMILLIVLAAVILVVYLGRQYVLLKSTPYR